MSDKRIIEMLKNATFEDVEGRTITPEAIAKMKRMPPGFQPAPPKPKKVLVKPDLGGKSVKQLYEEQQLTKERQQQLGDIFDEEVAKATQVPSKPVFSPPASLLEHQQNFEIQNLTSDSTTESTEDDAQESESSAPTFDPVKPKNVSEPKVPSENFLRAKASRERFFKASKGYQDDSQDSEVEIPTPESKPKVQVQEKVNQSPVLLRAKSKIDPKFQRISLPSRCQFYDFDELHMRPFTVPDMFKIAQVNNTRNLTLLIDLIDSTITEDVRSLTKPDFYYLLYSQKYMSYPRTPFTISWTSKYGNLATSDIKKSELDIIESTLDRQEYEAEFLSKGYCIPTVRDWELLDSETLEEELRWTYNKAQYMVGNTLEEKIKRLYDIGVEALELLPIIDVKTLHGVNEQVTVTDRLFDPARWLKRLRFDYQLKSKNFEEQAAGDLTDLAELEALSAEIETIAQEIERIETALELGTPVTAEPEKVRVKIDIFTFFPAL